jgi:hypothetical protein
MNLEYAGEVIRERVPRFVLSMLFILMFYLIRQVFPPLIEGIIIPGIGITPFNRAEWLIWTVSTLVMIVFFVRAMSDVLVLMDSGITFFAKIFGLKEEKSLRRVGKDFIFIILAILIGEAVSPFLSWNPEIGSSLNLIIGFSTLGIVLILMFDAGRILYRFLEDKAKLLADWLINIVERMENRKVNDY